MSFEDQHLITQNEIVICQICGKEYDLIGNRHLKKYHNITLEEYRIQFPDSPTITKIKFEKELNSIQNRKNGKKLIDHKTKEVPCYFHSDRKVIVNINQANVGLCDECKQLKRILPGQKLAVEGMRKTIKEKFNVDNISQLQEVIEKRKEKWEQKTDEEKKQIVEKRNKTIEEQFGSNWKMELHELSKKGMLEKYGFEYALQIDEFITKFKNTLLEKDDLKIKEMIEKVKKSKLERHGDENFNNIEKIKQTNIEKYGGNAPTCSPDVIKKRKKSNLKKWGNEETLSVLEIREKINETNSILGWPSQRPEWKEKYKQTSNKRFGSDSWMSSEYGKQKLKEKQIKKFLPKLQKQLDYLYLEILDLPYRGAHESHTFQCKKCNFNFTQNWNAVQQGFQCPKCYPRNNGRSRGEEELAEFIKSLGFEIITNSKKIIPPYEVDIFIPDKKIGIEYCGLYYHSEEFLENKRNIERPELYHFNKTMLCQKQNIQLISIFEDEWIYKKDIVINRLKHILGKFNGDRIFARKCEIKEIDSNTKNNFLELFHIQGKDISSINIGAYYNSILVSIMTFSKGNISKGSKYEEGTWELNRFCSNYRFHIPGIASRLLRYFTKNYEWNEIYSYADRRWSNGNTYYKLGFIEDGKPKLNYWYIKNFQRIHRFNLRKLPSEPKDITERTLRLKQGYAIIWDCGNLKFIMKK